MCNKDITKICGHAEVEIRQKVVCKNPDWNPFQAKNSFNPRVRKFRKSKRGQRSEGRVGITGVDTSGQQMNSMFHNFGYIANKIEWLFATWDIKEGTSTQRELTSKMGRHIEFRQIEMS